jgi:hypothetical protein
MFECTRANSYMLKLVEDIQIIHLILQLLVIFSKLVNGELVIC